MSTNMSNDKNIPTDAEGCYEELADQEEMYLEETEEELRAVLTSDDPRAEYWRSTREEGELNWEIEISVTGNSDPGIAASLDRQLNHAAEELNPGDFDDAPLCEDSRGVESHVRQVRARHELLP